MLAPPNLEPIPGKEPADIQPKDEKQSNDEVPSARDARLGEPGGSGDEPSKLTDSGDELSDQERAQLREINCALVGEHILAYATGGALWQRREGLVADLPVGPLLRMVEDVTGGSALNAKERADIVSWIGERFIRAVRGTDADFFLQIGRVLKARREGRDLATVTAKELGLLRRRGRKPQGFDLSRVFPLAVIGVTMPRHEISAAPGEFTKKRISRNELLIAIRNLQGAKFVISESELSRWITRYGLNPFMERPSCAKIPRI